MLRFCQSVSIAVALLIFTPSASWGAEPENPLLGRWLVQRLSARDAATLPVQLEWEFTKKKVVVRDVTNAEEISSNSYTLDLEKDPKWITVTVVSPAPLATEERLGIFRIVGDELHLHQTIDGGARPTEFPKVGDLVLKRQK